ncbi:MAG: hypothetical protein ABI769_17490 [Pseudomonadota bacterium]
MTFEDGGRIQLRRGEEMANHLRQAANISCDGHLDFDLQDSRVLYFACLDRSAVYRFEPPYHSATRIVTNSENGLRFPQVGELVFASILGDKYVYAWGGRDLLFRIDLALPSKVQEFDRFATPGAPLELSSPQSRSADRDSPESSLIGVAPDLRIHEVIGKATTHVVVVRPGRPDLVVDLPGEFGRSDHVTRRYVAKSQIVIWLLREALHGETVFAVDLATGKTMQANLPAIP